jgi:hypothetical protein
MMEIADYSKENFFSYRVDIPSIAYAKQYLEERKSPRQGKELTIIIPDRNEDPEALRTTVIQLAMSNFLTGIFHQIDNEHFRIKRIIVSDQSDIRIAMNNRGSLYTVRDVLYNTLKEADIPEIYHLRFDTEMSQLVYDYLKDPLRLSMKDRDRPIRGKGINMALSSLVSSDVTGKGISDHDAVLVFMDAENKAVNYKDPFLLGSPLIYEGSPVLFSKAAFKRYHMEGERRKLGGRVNASLGVPLLSMLIHEELLPVKKAITYPLAGEIGIDRNLWWSIKISERYGVEMTTLLQLFGKDDKGKTMLPEESFAQVDLGINMDQPLAEGKPPREVLAGVRRMSEDIIAATFQIMGRQMRETWESSTEFMRTFGEFQRHSIERWMQAHDTRIITGGIDHEELRRTVYAVVKEHADNFFLEESFLKRILREFRETLYHRDVGFIPPINDIRDDMKDAFDELRERLINIQERIYPEKKET